MKKITIKGISFVMSVIIMVVGFAPNLVSASDGDTYGDYVVETKVSEGVYTKLKITNKITGEIEWLESYDYSDGTSYSIATSENEKYTIENDLDQITVIKDNKVFEIIDLEEEVNLEEKISEPTTYKYGAWGPMSWTYSSRNTRVTIVSACIGIIATILGVPKGKAIAISIGTTVFSLLLPNVYYKVGKQLRYDPSTYKHQVRKATMFYSVSNYTGYIDGDSIIYDLNR